MAKIVIALVVIAAGVWYFATKQSIPAPQNEPMKIGVLAPLTGDLTVLGGRIRNGMELAKEEILQQDLADTVELIFEDACLPKDAVSASRKLIQVDKVSILGGSFCLIGLVPVIPIAEENKVIVFKYE